MVTIYFKQTISEVIAAMLINVLNVTTGDTVEMSDSEGSFIESQLVGLSHLIMFAAGTGFTPMIRLLNATCCKLKEGPRYL